MTETETRKPWEVEAAERRATAQAGVDRLGLTVESEFVPFSRSRNAKPAEKGGKPWLSLNWRVTLKRGGRVILGPVDYSAGVAHCPSHGTKAPASYDRNPKNWEREAAEAECESGFPVRRRDSHHFRADRNGPLSNFDRKRPILPDPLDVIHGLLLDGAGALDSGGFENWAADLGFDTDSRKAESIWQACLDTGLKLRGGLGEVGIEALQEAFRDW